MNWSNHHRFLESPTMNSNSSFFPSIQCVICGGTPNGNRYGVVACLGCIVFFRRAVSKGNLRKCKNNFKCVINCNTKNDCRSCRLQKCLKVGMDPKAIRHRDLLGPRIAKPSTDITIKQYLSTEIDFVTLLDIQRKQHHRNLRYRKNSSEKEERLKIKQKSYRRATSEDIGLVMSLGFQNATAWANHIPSFWNLKTSEKNAVLSEFGIAFLLIDQAFKSAYEADEGFWLLENDTFLYLDYFLRIPSKDAEKVNVKEQARIHFDFVNDLLNCLVRPVQNLQLDKFECAVLKLLILSTPSFPGFVKLRDVHNAHTKCMGELMKYSISKYDDIGPERFGEIILLMSSIRCAVKTFYNHTKRSDLFNISNFDSFTRTYIVS